MRSIILGAGVTGLAAGFKTGFPIYEASDKPGGICRSYERDGFEFSVGGGHWIFGDIGEVKNLVELNTYERRAGIYYNHTFPYPFQTCAEQNFTHNRGSMKSWMLKNFGKAECNLFFNPFNEKYTAGFYDDIVPVDKYKSPPAGGKGFCPVFYDPVDGLNALIDAMAAKCDIKYDSRAVRINLKGKFIEFNDTVVPYDKLISTIPLDEMMNMCGQPCDLPYSSVVALNIGATADVNTPKEHWLYVPFCKSGFYRVGVYSNIRPNKNVSMWVEIATKPPKNIIDIGAVIDELKSWRFIGDVITSDYTFIEHAYTWNRTLKERERCLNWLKEHDIISIGRYGKWKFQGIAESIADGLGVMQSA